MKVTETRLDTLIDNLNTLICEDDLLTRQERETLVRAVAAIGAMKARVSMKKPTVPAASKPKEEKQAPIPDRKRAARTVLTGMCYSVGSATRQGSSSLTRFIGQSAMTSRT